VFQGNKNSLEMKENEKKESIAVYSCVKLGSTYNRLIEKNARVVIPC